MEGSFSPDDQEGKVEKTNQERSVYIGQSHDQSAMFPEQSRDFVFSTTDLRDQALFSTQQGRDMASYSDPNRDQLVYVRDTRDFSYGHQNNDVLLNPGREFMFSDVSRDLVYNPPNQNLGTISQISRQTTNTIYQPIPQTSETKFPTESPSVLYQQLTKEPTFHDRGNVFVSSKNLSQLTEAFPQSLHTKESIYPAQLSTDNISTSQSLSQERYLPQTMLSTSQIEKREDKEAPQILDKQRGASKHYIIQTESVNSQNAPVSLSYSSTNSAMTTIQSLIPDIRNVEESIQNSSSENIPQVQDEITTLKPSPQDNHREINQRKESSTVFVPKVNRIMAAPAPVMKDVSNDLSHVLDVTDHVMVYEGNMQFMCLFCSEKIVISCHPEGHVLFISSSRNGGEDSEDQKNPDLLSPNLTSGSDESCVQHSQSKNSDIAKLKQSDKGLHISSGLFGKKKAAGKYSLNRTTESLVKRGREKDIENNLEERDNSESEDPTDSLPVEKQKKSGRGRPKGSKNKNTLFREGKKQKCNKSHKKSTGKIHLERKRKLQSLPLATKSKRSNEYMVTRNKKDKISKPVMKLKERTFEKSVDAHCDLCNQRIKGKKAMAKHLKKHLKPSSYDCDICHKRFRIPSQMLRHKSIVHEGNKPYVCDICNKAFAKRDRLQIHQDSHTGHKRYNCSVCGLAFSHNGNMRRHLLTHYGERRFHCEICGKKFFQKINLISHQRLHTGERPYRCEFCGKSFRQRSNLSSHQKVHGVNKTPPRTDGIERPFICEVCGKSFKHKAGLCMHKKSHADVKPLACEFCNKRFIQKTTLLQHRRLHTGEKPYSCSYCGKKFSSLNNRKRHEKIHTGERPFKCDICGKAFIQKVGLTAHLKTHDKRDEPKFFLNVIEPHMPSLEPVAMNPVSQATLQPILNQVHYEWTPEHTQLLKLHQ